MLLRGRRSGSEPFGCGPRHEGEGSLHSFTYVPVCRVAPLRADAAACPRPSRRRGGAEEASDRRETERRLRSGGREQQDRVLSAETEGKAQGGVRADGAWVCGDDADPVARASWVWKFATADTVRGWSARTVQAASVARLHRGSDR